MMEIKVVIQDIATGIDISYRLGLTFLLKSSSDMRMIVDGFVGNNTYCNRIWLICWLFELIS
jgi:hypothetical protein